jgi:hypothetical protein
VERAEQQVVEYTENLNLYEAEISRLSVTNDTLKQDCLLLHKDQQVKFKLLGTLLMVTNKLDRTIKNQTLKRLFSKWRDNCQIAIIVQTVFTKIMKLNFKHTQKRF